MRSNMVASLTALKAAMMTLSILVEVTLYSALRRLNAVRDSRSAWVNLGVRPAPGQMLLFSNAEHDELAAIADASGVKVSFCKLPGTAMWGTRAVRAVWYGVGNSSYVRLFDEANASRDVHVRVDRTAMEVLRGDKIDFKCISAPSPTGRASDARPS